jgi:hypothetical protein
MHAIAKLLGTEKLVRLLALSTLGTGAGGMAISFLFLASAHPLDVVAGAAGFVAGSILAATGLLVTASVKPTGLTPEATPAPSLPLDRWLTHYRRNRQNRTEPDWSTPITLPEEVVRPLVRSLEQFQLGDGGGPAYLIARNRERFLAAGEGTRQLVDLWFAEEREHARLLGAAVARFGGRCIRDHWSFQIFCLVRKWLGVRFELTVLLLTEIVSTVYYQLLRRHGKDPALRAMCRLILRDEMGHVAFHRDRLAHAGRAGYGTVWEVGFRVLGLAAASMLWINHAPGLQAVGARGGEFYREVWQGLSRFIRRLRRDVSSAAARPREAAMSVHNPRLVSWCVSW